MTALHLAPVLVGACLVVSGPGLAQTLGASPTAPTAALPAAAALTLADALARARAQAPQLRAASARATAAAEAADATRAWRAPTLDLSVENLGPQDLEHDGFVWFTQPLDIGARRTTRIAAAHATRDALSREVDLQRHLLDAEVVQVYLAVARGRQAVDLLTTHAQDIGEAVELLRRRVAEGVAPEGDLRKLEAERARVGLSRMRTELELRQQALHLAVLTGEDPTTLADRVGVPPAPPLATVDVATAVERRPDVRAAVARLEERRTAAAAERALGGTAVAAMGGYKRTAGLHTGTAGISIDLPIGARNRPARLRAAAEETAAAAELELARSRARADIEQALLAAQLLSSHAARVATDLVEPAAVAQRAARAAFREGTGDALALVDANRVYLDTRREALAVQLDAAAASIGARLALGEDPLP